MLSNNKLIAQNYLILISIITPAFNSESTIIDTLKSVFNQSFRNFEYIIIDGSSTNETEMVINQFNESNLIYISEPDNGLYDAINKGLKSIKGDIFGILNADDRFYDSEVLFTINNIFDSNPNIDCVFGNLVYVNKSGNIVREWISKDFEPGLFEKNWSPAHPTFYCRKKVLESLIGYKTDYEIASDVDFMFRALEIHKYKSHYINRFLAEMNIGGKSTSGIKSTIIITKEMIRVFAENGQRLNLIKYLFFKFLKLREFKLPFWLN